MEIEEKKSLKFFYERLRAYSLFPQHLVENQSILSVFSQAKHLNFNTLCFAYIKFPSFFWVGEKLMEYRTDMIVKQVRSKLGQVHVQK